MAILSTWVNICAIILPLNLTEFSAQKGNSDVSLQWKTANETNMAYYDVERSYDAQSFTAISRVNAKNATTNTYTFSDNAASSLSSANAYYRIKMTDAYGRYKYSAVVKIANGKQTTISVFPNPVTNVISISGLKNKDVIRILSIDGKVLLQQTTTAQSLILNVENYKAGSYILQVQNDKEVSQQKFVKY